MTNLRIFKIVFPRSAPPHAHYVYPASAFFRSQAASNDSCLEIISRDLLNLGPPKYHITQDLRQALSPFHDPGSAIIDPSQTLALFCFGLSIFLQPNSLHLNKPTRLTRLEAADLVHARLRGIIETLRLLYLFKVRQHRSMITGGTGGDSRRSGKIRFSLSLHSTIIKAQKGVPLEQNETDPKEKPAIRLRFSGHRRRMMPRSRRRQGQTYAASSKHNAVALVES